MFTNPQKLSKNVKKAMSWVGYEAIVLGYQARLCVDLGNITLDARYEGGLTRINKKYGERPNLWNFTIGFKIL